MLDFLNPAWPIPGQSVCIVLTRKRVRMGIPVAFWLPPRRQTTTPSRSVRWLLEVPCFIIAQTYGTERQDTIPWLPLPQDPAML